MRNTFERLVEQAGITPRDIAARSGLSVERVEAILAGRWLASPADRAKLASVVGLPVDQIDWGHTMSPRNIRYHQFGFPDTPDNPS
ncbi:MAG: helix-turn-helix transcriptional regulator [Pirellulaceae bacterium]